MKCPASFIKFYNEEVLQLVEATGTPKKGRKFPSVAESAFPEFKAKKQSGEKSIPAVHLNNMRSALYNYKANADTCVTLRDYIDMRYEDKCDFFNNFFVS